jgi:hypothetical protein
MREVITMPFFSFGAFISTAEEYMSWKDLVAQVAQVVSFDDQENSTFSVSNWGLGNVVQIHAASTQLVLRHSGFDIVVQLFSEEFRDDASFTLVAGLVNPGVGIDVGSGLVSFESVNVPNHFIMYRGSNLILGTINDFAAQEAATWFVNPPNQPNLP